MLYPFRSRHRHFNKPFVEAKAYVLSRFLTKQKLLEFGINEKLCVVLLLLQIDVNGKSGL